MAWGFCACALFFKHIFVNLSDIDSIVTLCKQLNSNLFFWRYPKGDAPIYALLGCSSLNCIKIIVVIDAANDFSKEGLALYRQLVDQELTPGYQIQDYLRSAVFTDWKDLNELIDYSIENYISKGIRIDAGDVMAKFVVERRGYTGSTKSSYSK